jgi:hypothetical protein
VNVDVDPQLRDRLDRLESAVMETRKAAEDSRRYSRLLVILFVVVPIVLLFVSMLFSFLSFYVFNR